MCIYSHICHIRTYLWIHLLIIHHPKYGHGAFQVCQYVPTPFPGWWFFCLRWLPPFFLEPVVVDWRRSAPKRRGTWKVVTWDSKPPCISRCRLTCVGWLVDSALGRKSTYIYIGKKAIKGPRLQRRILYRSLGTSVHHHFFLPLEWRLKTCAAWRWVDCAEKKGSSVISSSSGWRIEALCHDRYFPKWKVGTGNLVMIVLWEVHFVLVRKYLSFSEF